MAEDFKYKLTFETLSTGTGGKQTVEQLEQMERTVGRLTTRQADLRAEFAGVSDRFDATRIATYNLDAAVKKTDVSTQAFTGTVNKMGAPVRNNAQALLMFSQGFEDASYGIRGVLNNIPGLVVALGGGAGLAGGISIAAVALSQILPLLTKTEEKASDVADRIKATAENIAGLETDRFETVGDAIDAAAAATAALKQEWDATRQAEQDFSAAALSNAEKMQQAQALIAEVLGLQVDRFKELENIAAAAAAKREQEARAALAAEDKRLKAAQDEVSTRAQALSDQETRLALEQAKLVTLQGQLQTLKEQEAQLKKTASLAAGGILPTAAGELPDPEAAGKFLAGTQAQQKLDSQVFQSQLLGTAKAVEDLTAKVREFSDANNGVIVRAATSLTAAQTKLSDVQAAVDLAKERIDATFAADTTLAKAEQIAQSGQLFAQQIERAFGQVEAFTAQGQSAKDSLLSAAADGKITAEETLQVARGMQTLIGALQSGQAQSNTNLKELLAIQKEFADQQLTFRDEIRNLREQVRVLNSK